MAFTLTPEQHQAVYDRGGGLLVSAAAGSGKTRVLVERLLAKVESGVDIDRFLIITFTKAAAAELRDRIVSELADRIALYPEDAFLRRQATLVYQAQISTIHSFCGELLREEGHRLELDHDFRLCDETEAQVLLGEVLNEVLDRRYETIEEDREFAFLVDTMSAGRDDRKLMEIVLDIRSRIQSHPDPEQWLAEQEESFRLEGVTDLGQTAWGELLLADARRQAGYWQGQMARALELCEGDEVLSKAYAPSLTVSHSCLEKLCQAAEEGWDATAEAAEQVEFPRLGSARKCEDPAAQEQIKQLRDRCKKRMEKLRLSFQDRSEELLADLRAMAPAVHALFALIRDLEAAYTARKRKRGVLDFGDLEHLSARLLLSDGEPTPLAQRWGERYEEVMVDEYQDTNAVQNAIFNALTDGGRNLFMVGDVKQSIYRFRLADPTIFLEKYRSYRSWTEAEEGEPRRVLLSQNFRSRPQVLEGCNYLFRSVMSESFGEMDYTDEEALIPGGKFPEQDSEDYRVELDLLDCSTQEEEEGPKVPRDLLEARWAARRIRQLLDEKFPVSDGEGGLRPVQSGDIVILLRSPGTVLHHYGAALGEQNIPWEADGGGDFFGSTEIQATLSLLRVIDNPRQDVPLIAVLRSALYQFSADRLAQIRSVEPEGDFYTALTKDGGADSQSFLRELALLRRQAGEMGVAQLLWTICDRTNLLGVYGGMEEGQLRRSSLLYLVQLARDFETAGHKGLFLFLNYLQRLQDSGTSLRSPGGVEAGGGVRIMSIHRSKGLEFPVVLLCGLSRRLNRQDMNEPILFHPKLGVGPKRLDLDRMVEYPTVARLAVQRQMSYELSAEELRLLYVAMTRAKEKLILSCALTRGEKEVRDLLPMAATPVEPQALLDSDSATGWILLAALARPEAQEFWQGSGRPPFDAKTDFGPAWDIRWQEVTQLQTAPRPRQLSQQPETEGVDETALLERFRWSYPHGESVDVPSKVTATQLKGRGLDEEVAEDAAEETDRRPKAMPEGEKSSGFPRPRFAAEKLGLTPAQKGTAQHLAMQYLDFSRTGSQKELREEVQRLVEEQFLTPEQGEAVDVKKLHGFFHSPTGEMVLSAPTLRREFKFSILVPARRYYPTAEDGEQVLLQGVVDCYLEDLEGITVLDFKTDHVYGEDVLRRAEEYRPQITAYAEALSEITGRPVCRRILWFFSENRAVEV